MRFCNEDLSIELLVKLSNHVLELQHTGNDHCKERAMVY